MATLEIDEDVIIRPADTGNPTATTFKRLKSHEQPMITLTGKYGPSYTISTAHSVTPMDLMFYGGSTNWEDYFTFENNSIRIKGNKIRKVIISGQALVSRGPDGADLRLALRWNKDWATLFMCGFKDWTGENLPLPMRIYDVKDGDTFDLAIGGSVAGTYTLVYGDNSTMLTVWAVDYDL